MAKKGRALGQSVLPIPSRSDVRLKNNSTLVYMQMPRPRTANATDHVCRLMNWQSAENGRRESIPRRISGVGVYLLSSSDIKAAYAIVTKRASRSPIWSLRRTLLLEVACFRLHLPMLGTAEHVSEVHLGQ